MTSGGENNDKTTTLGGHHRSVPAKIPRSASRSWFSCCVFPKRRCAAICGKWEDLNMVSRYHGGVRLNDGQSEEPPMLIKSETNVSSKNQVARLAASMIKDNQMIYIDAGSSTFEMLNYVRAKISPSSRLVCRTSRDSSAAPRTRSYWAERSAGRRKRSLAT